MKRFLKKSVAMSLCVAMLLSVFCVSAEAKPLKDYKVHNSGWLGFGGTWDYQKNNDGEDTISILRINSTYGQKVPKVIDNHYVTQFVGIREINFAIPRQIAEAVCTAFISTIVHSIADNHAYDLSEVGGNLTYINHCHLGVTGIDFRNIKYVGDKLLLKNGGSFNFDLRKAEHIGFLGKEYRDSVEFSCSDKYYYSSESFQLDSLKVPHALRLPEVYCEVSEGAFRGRNEFILPEGVNNIDLSHFSDIKNEIFAGCSGLRGKLILPVGCEEIGVSAFEGCSGITGLDISNRAKLGDKAFFNCSNIEGHIDLSKAMSIGVSAFENCEKIRSVDLSSAMRLDDYSFKNCCFLKEIKLNSGIQNIGKETFKDCYSLSLAKNEPLDLSDCDIGDRAFENCTNLEGTVLLSKDRIVSKDAFKGCDNLTIQYVD